VGPLFLVTPQEGRDFKFGVTPPLLNAQKKQFLRVRGAGSFPPFLGFVFCFGGIPFFPNFFLEFGSFDNPLGFYTKKKLNKNLGVCI